MATMQQPIYGQPYPNQVYREPRVDYRQPRVIYEEPRHFDDRGSLHRGRGYDRD